MFSASIIHVYKNKYIYIYYIYTCFIFAFLLLLYYYIVLLFKCNLFITDPASTNMDSEVKRKSFFLQLLPLRSRKKMTRSASKSNVRHIEATEELKPDTVLLSDDFTSSSEEEQENGHENNTFDAEDNCNAVLYKSFGNSRTRRGNIKDGADIHHLDEGKCVVADLLNCRLVIFAKSGKCNTTIQNDDIVEPWGLAVHENIILVTSRRTKRVIKLSQTGNSDESSFGESYFQDPCGIAVTKDHMIVVGDIQAKKVSVHEWCGTWLYDISLPDNHGLKLPRYITVSPLGDILISDSGNHCVFLFSGNGTFKKSFGSYGSGDGQLKAPYGICCDKFGNIFVADHYNDRISLYSKDGEFICHILTKEDEIFHPQGISVSHDNKLFVTHGSLKACEVKVFTLNNTLGIPEGDKSIFHV